MTSRDRIDAYMAENTERDQRSKIFKAAGMKQYRYQYNPMDNLINKDIQCEADREEEINRQRFASSASSGTNSSVYTSTYAAPSFSVSSKTSNKELRYPQHPYQNNSSTLTLNTDNFSSNHSSTFSPTAANHHYTGLRLTF